MYDMTVMKQSSEIEMKAISNAMYGKFEGSKFPWYIVVLLAVSNPAC